MRRDHVKYALLEITFWCSFGAFTSFAFPYLLSAGLSAGVLGVAAAVNTVCSLTGGFVWSTLCDRAGSNKRVFLLLNALLMGVYVALYLVPKAAVPVVALYGLLGFVQGPMVAVLDTWILREMRREMHRFGPIRAWASLAYSVFVLGYSRLIQGLGYRVMLPMAALFVAASITVALMTGETRAARGAKGAPGVSYGAMLASPMMFGLILALLFSGMAIAPNTLALGVLVSGLSGGVALQGMAMFVGTLFQGPTMILYPKLHRLPVLGKMGIAVLLYMAGSLSMALIAAPLGIMLSSSLNGIAYGLLLPAMREAITAAAEDSYLTRAQGLAESAFSAAGPTLSNAASGMMIEQFGVRTLLLLCACIQVLPLLCFGWLKRRGRE